MPCHKRCIDDSFSSSDDDKKKKGIYNMQKFQENTSIFKEGIVCFKYPKDDCNDMVAPLEFERVIPGDIGVREEEVICLKDDCNEMMTPFDLERVIPEDVLQRWRDAIKLSNTLPAWSYHYTPLMLGW
ncbi:hypothetical protein Tco_0017950 [Tanacetum coccineum]